jgi:hypothetical protein
MCQEDKDMADQNEAKTKTIGFLPKEKVQALKGWDELRRQGNQAFSPKNRSTKGQEDRKGSPKRTT